MMHASGRRGVVSQPGVIQLMHLIFAVIVNGRAMDAAPYLGLSQCHAVPRQRTEMPAADDKIPPTWRHAAPGSRC